MSQITNFKIEGLHGSITVDIPIEDGRVILVGANGLGKTTIVSMLYCVITKQWRKLLEYDFESVSVSIGSEVAKIERSLLTSPDVAWQQSLFESLPPSIADRVFSSPDFHSLVREGLEGGLRRSDVIKVSRK